jgi:uncharacterized protein with PQ loop repeat
MTYIKTYEGFRSSLAKAGILGSLALNPSISKGEVGEMDPKEMRVSQEYSQDLKNKILEMSKKRRDLSKDTILNNILDEIEMSLLSESPEKYIELFNKLSSHIENKYDYKIEEKNIENLDLANLKDLDFILLMGWIGSLCLSICGLPQAWLSFKEKSSDGISWGFLLLWGFGELFGISYVVDKADAPLIVNYATNILIIGVILYYKINPRRDTIDENIFQK